MGAPHPLLLPLLTGDTIRGGAVIDLDVVESAEEHWVAALIDDVVSVGSIEVTPDARKRLAARSLATKAEVDACTATASHAVKTADSLGIDIAVFKGLANARFYENPMTRPSIDVDIFLAPDDAGRMGELSVALGADHEEQSAIDGMVAEGRVFETSVTIEGIVVDIHRDPMNMVTLSRIEHDRWLRTVPLTLPDGTETRTLDPEDSLLQALLHLFRDNFADLLHINDVRLMIDAEPDWDTVAVRAQAEGWKDIIRFALWFVCDTLDRPSPLPTDIARWRKLVIDRIWPHDLLLQGHASHARSLRRQSALGLLVANDLRAHGHAYGRRLAPPRSVIEHRSGGSGEPYPVALAKWRLEQRRRSRVFSDAGGDQ